MASGSSPFVMMVKAADLRKLDDLTGASGMNRPPVRGVHLKRLVNAPVVVVTEVTSQDSPEMPLIQHDQVVQAFSADAPDEPFDVRVLPRAPRAAAMTMPNLASLLETFFTDRLMRQRQASPHTIASYRDSFHLLLVFAQQQLKKAPSTLALTDIDAPLIGAFLDSLEKTRGSGSRTRNTRLAAIRSFFRFTAFTQPEHSALIQRVLAMPTKRYDRRPIEFLTRPQIDALLAAPLQTTWLGRRDRTLLLVAVQTGLRVSELISLRCQDVVLGAGAHVCCLGKGRKERCTPLRRDSTMALSYWLRERRGQPSDPLFPNQRGGSLSRDAVERLLAKHLTLARVTCPSLRHKRVSPHVLRHTAAMELLQHGVDRSVIALWLGHESVETTQMYLQASLAMKELALAKTTPLNVSVGRYRPDDHLLAFLRSL